MSIQPNGVMVEIEHCGVAAKTENATCFTFATVNGESDVWLPESQMDYWDDELVTIPEWLAIEKGLV